MSIHSGLLLAFETKPMPAPIAKAPRKRPRQRRSQQTVAAILEATAHILVTDGYNKLTTNRVAEVAGVSIGSLYQYFPNKQALVLALAEEHLGREIARLSAMTTELQKLSLAQATRKSIHAVFEAFAVDAELHRAIVTDVVHLGEPLVKALQSQAEFVVRAALERRRDEILPTDIDLAAFFIVSAVDAIAIRALTVAGDRFSLETLEREVCELILRYLMGTPSEESAH